MVWGHWLGSMQPTWFRERYSDVSPCSSIRFWWQPDCRGFLWPRLQRSCGGQCKVGLWDPQRQRLLRFSCSPFSLSLGESSSQGDPSWCLLWHAGLQRSSGAGVLESGACGTTTVPGSWGTSALAATVVLLSKVSECADLLLNWDLGLRSLPQWL